MKNIFINTTVPDMFQFDKKISGKMDCRKHYEKMGFTEVKVNFNPKLGLSILAFKGDDKQELFIPERYIICVGVDYESEQPE